LVCASTVASPVANARSAICLKETMVWCCLVVLSWFVFGEKCRSR
jgi:hypothetical protein